MIEPAERMQQFSAHFFAALNRRVGEMRAAGLDVIRLDEGAPDLPPAAHILHTLLNSAQQPNHHGYQPQSGIPELRRAWADMYQKRHGVALDPEAEVLPLLGSKEGIFHLPLAYLNPGDVALVPDPGYITYTRGAQAAGGQVFYLPLRPEGNYLPDLPAIPLDVLRRARLLWLNYPNNPTSAIASREFFAAAVAFAHQHGLLVCHDAAYTQVTYDGYQAPSLLEIPGAKEVAVEFNTLSKSHNMAGWRTAALLGNPQVVRAFHTLKTNVDSGHFLPILEAAAAALTGDQGWLQTRNEIYRQRRDALLAALRSLGLEVRTPRASLYVWSPLPSSRSWDSAGFAAAALEHTQVSFTPGTVFGPGGEGYVRFSLTAPLERVMEAGERLKHWLK